MLPLTTIVYRLLWAALLGALVGVERIRSKRPAGLRTSLFVCMAAALFTIVSIEFAKMTGDSATTRIASNIVQGIGFLGAGVILREKGSVVGMTTAATIFLTAAMGMAAGSGLYKVSGFVCIVMLFALVILVRVERVFKLRSRYILFRVTAENAAGFLPEIRQLFGEMKLPLDHLSVSLVDGKHILQFDADLNESQEEKIVSKLCSLGLGFEVLPGERQSA
ncbi:MAG TPA: MgtC/SapB family protein [Candidatus Dormibacteraeota bacterium]|jgi:putative Mg2+ transporter-C (MgtC) family protein|nr:MgtC/SapB family protein [Candidatus Dormibacteraeota bacterium]